MISVVFAKILVVFSLSSQDDIGEDYCEGGGLFYDPEVLKESRDNEHRLEAEQGHCENMFRLKNIIEITALKCYGRYHQRVPV